MPAGELVDVAAQMLHTHLVVRPVVASFQECPKGFDPVGMGLSIHVFAHGMLNRMMLVNFPQALVCPVVVCVDRLPNASTIRTYAFYQRGIRTEACVYTGARIIQTLGFFRMT